MSPKPLTDAIVHLTGKEQHLYEIIDLVVSAIRKSNRPDLAGAFIDDVDLSSEATLLAICRLYVTVERGV